MSEGVDLPEFPLSLHQLAARYGLSPVQCRQLSAFAAMLAYDELAATTVREPRAVLDDHLADSLIALELPELAARRTGSVIADLGAGAGVPGIPLAIAIPGARVILVESNDRKCEFMRGAVATLGLANAEVVWSRAETWSDGLRVCDVVLARALAPMDVVEEYAAPLLRIDGVLIAWRGRRDPALETEAAGAAEILGLERPSVVPVVPYPGVDGRHLHVARKLRDTPPRFPRRDGVARKRPLGSR